MSNYNIITCTDKSTVVSEYTPAYKTAADYQSEADLEREFINILIQQGGIPTIPTIKTRTKTKLKTLFFIQKYPSYHNNKEGHNRKRAGGKSALPTR